jgi:hypothetical protein
VNAKGLNMNIKRTALYSALLATALIGAPALAQDSNNDANGSSSNILPKPGQTKDNAAQQAAPGKMQKSGEAGTAQEVAPGQQQKAGTSTAQEAAPGQQQKCAAGQTGKNCAQGDMTGQATTKQQPKQQTGEATTTEQPKRQTSQATQQQSGGSGGTTVGAAGTSNETTASINVTTEQQTEMRQVITETKVEPAQVDFDVTVGVAVPKTVHLHRLPARVVKLVPAYEGYEYFVLADGRIVIVEPDTLKIVYILSA